MMVSEYSVTVSSCVTCHPPGPLEAQHVGIVEHPGDLLPPGHLVPQQPLPRPAHLRQFELLICLCQFNCTVVVICTMRAFPLSQIIHCDRINLLQVQI